MIITTLLLIPIYPSYNRYIAEVKQYNRYYILITILIYSMLILKYLLNEIIKNIVNYRIINSEQLPDAHVFHIGWIATIYFNNIFPQPSSKRLTPSFSHFFLFLTITLSITRQILKPMLIHLL
jgi:hypothetical protein